MTIRVEALWSAGTSGGLVLQLEDDGTGLTPEVAAQLAAGPLTTKTLGTGTGLPLCRELLRRYGGQLALVPRASGGARVTVSRS